MDNITLGNKNYQVEEELDFDSFVVSRKDKKYVLRKFDSLSGFHTELNQRKKLKKLGINSPKVLKKYKKDLVILCEFISDKTMLDVLLKEDIAEDDFKELFNIYRFARFSQVELNYLPENFAMKNGRMYYLSLDIGPKNEEKNLENYGIYFWVYSPQLVEHLKALNIEVDKKRILTIPEANKKIVLISVMHW